MSVVSHRHHPGQKISAGACPHGHTSPVSFDGVARPIHLLLFPVPGKHRNTRPPSARRSAMLDARNGNAYISAGFAPSTPKSEPEAAKLVQRHPRSTCRASPPIPSSSSRFAPPPVPARFRSRLAGRPRGKRRLALPPHGAPAGRHLAPWTGLLVAVTGWILRPFSSSAVACSAAVAGFGACFPTRCHVTSFMRVTPFPWTCIRGRPAEMRHEYTTGNMHAIEYCQVYEMQVCVF
jgi:hypothetical protein